MKKRTFLALFCAAALMISVLAGCQAKTALSPQATVTAYFQAMKKMDFKTMDHLSADTSSSGFWSLVEQYDRTSSNTDSQTERTIAKALLNKVSCQVKGSPVVSGDTAAVKVRVTAPDMGTILQNAVSSEVTAEFSRLTAKTSSSSVSTPNITDDVQSELGNGKVKMLTTDLTLHLVKEENQWKIRENDQIATAVAGKLVTYAEKLNSLAVGGDS